MNNIATACEILKQGDLIVMPTETVYGLAGDATNATAVQKIYAIKSRPNHNPLIIHCANRQGIAEFATITALGEQLLQHFTQSPLTLILPLQKHSKIAQNAAAGLKTIAVRIPNHSFAQELLQALPFPLAAPSANISGYLSPTSASHCHDLGVRVFDGGDCQYGLESTIVDASGDSLYLLRQGSISAEEISRIAPLSPAPAREKPLSPGQLLKHYKPNLPLVTDITSPNADDAYIAFGDCQLACFRNLSLSGDLSEAGRNLFAYLREADNSGKKRIAIAPIPKHGIGLAIEERLSKARILQKAQ